ncbi:alpha/beta fold hydrolase [Thermopirellula anaerolimosa]
MQRRHIAGVDLAVEIQGRGLPVVFVHGFPLDYTMWDAQIAEFSGDCQVLAPDLRGFGASGVTPGIVTMERFADDLAELADGVGIASQGVVLCGLSMGGYIAFQFLRKYAGLLRGLVLCNTRATADSDEVRENRYRLAAAVRQDGSEVVIRQMLPKLLAEQTRKERPDCVTRLEDMMRRASPEGIAAAALGMAERPDSTALLSSVPCPTLVVAGEFDVLSPPSEMRMMANAIPGARFEVIPGAGHMTPMERPDEFNAILRDYLKSL